MPFYLAGILTNDEAAAASENPSVPSNLPVDGAEWVELFVREMMSANSVDDARARAAKVLEVLEKSISARAGAEATQNFQKVSKLFLILLCVGLIFYNWSTCCLVCSIPLVSG